MLIVVMTSLIGALWVQVSLGRLSWLDERGELW